MQLLLLSRISSDFVNVHVELSSFACFQGVIFAIDFHEGHLQICSASDDRSIRLWQLRCHGDGEMLRCHGDGEMLSSGRTLTRWEDVSFEELCVFYGHSARVWGVRLLDDVIVSIGEVNFKQQFVKKMLCVGFVCGIANVNGCGAIISVLVVMLL